MIDTLTQGPAQQAQKPATSGKERAEPTVKTDKKAERDEFARAYQEEEAEAQPVAQEEEGVAGPTTKPAMPLPEAMPVKLLDQPGDAAEGAAPDPILVEPDAPTTFVPLPQSGIVAEAASPAPTDPTDIPDAIAQDTDLAPKITAAQDTDTPRPEPVLRTPVAVTRTETGTAEGLPTSDVNSPRAETVRTVGEAPTRPATTPSGTGETPSPLTAQADSPIRTPLEKPPEKQLEKPLETVEAAPRTSEPQMAASRPNPGQASPLPDAPVQETSLDPVEAGDDLRLADQPREVPRQQIQPSGLTPVKEAQVIRQVAEQLPARILTGTNGTFEVQLDPPDLGRITVRILGVEAGAIAQVSADRQDVLDLLRRNESMLSREFGASGFENLTFEFQNRDHSGQSANEDGAKQVSANVWGMDADGPGVPAADQRHQIMTGTQLDIRL